MRYKLGNNDYFAVVMAGTVLETCLTVTLTFDEAIREADLKRAVQRTLHFFPLLKTRLIFDKEYYLETNPAPVVIRACSFENRPLRIGRETNGYLWQLTYNQNRLTFDLFHALTDGYGCILFLSTIVNLYFQPDFQPGTIPDPDVLGYESLFDPSIRHFPGEKARKGFSRKDFPYAIRCSRYTLHELAVDKELLLRKCKELQLTPVSFLTPLFAKAIYENLPPDKDLAVRGMINVDGRRTAGVDTMHNFVLQKLIVYGRQEDGESLRAIGGRYRQELNDFKKEDHLIELSTKMIRTTEWLYRKLPRCVSRRLAKVIAYVVKSTRSNFVMTYWGTFPLAGESRITDLSVFSRPDMGGSTFSMIEINEAFHITISETFHDKRILPAFIRLVQNEGVCLRYRKSWKNTAARLDTSILRIH